MPLGKAGKFSGNKEKAALALKQACAEAADEATATAKAAGDGRRVVNGNRKYASAKEAHDAKIAAAKAKREAKQKLAAGN